MAWKEFLNPTRWFSRDPAVNAYCLVCKRRVDLRSVEFKVWVSRPDGNDGIGVHGVCPLCGRNVARLASRDEKQRFATTSNLS